ncbi:MAG: alkaline phosphatase family protein [Tannerellaceae bacterium]|nr:alkaline phosphatase family protein [Tannerellaceae bacterium]
MNWPGITRTLPASCGIRKVNSDYTAKARTPTLDSLARVGVKAAFRPSFPSVTFPNHYTMATGLHPDRNQAPAWQQPTDMIILPPKWKPYFTPQAPHSRKM